MPKAKQKKETPRVPRYIRRDLEKKLKKAEKKLTKGYFTMLENKKLCIYPENKIGHKSVTTFDKAWLSESGGDWIDPVDGKRKTIQLDKYITFERGRVRVKSGSKDLTEAVKPVTLERNEVVKFFRDAYEKASKDLKESLGEPESLRPEDWFSTSNSMNAGKLLPFPPGPYTRQLYLYDQWKMLARAASYYDYNPLAKSGVHIKTAFTIGTGPKVQITDESIQKDFDAFMEQNDFINRLKNYDRMLTTNGEFFGELYEKNGECKLRSIDPGTIQDIITEPRDIEEVYGYQLIYSTQYQIFGKGANGKQVPLSQFIYETLPPDNIIHLKINVQENEKRGRSDLLPVLDICQMFQDYLRYAVLKIIVQCAFSWDIKMMNAEQADIDAFKENEEAMFPPPASTFVHNDNVERQAVQSTGISDSGRSRTFEELVTAFSVGILLPKEYMGVGDAGTRATAITATEPSVKVFQDRRGLWETFIRKIAFYLGAKRGVELKPSDVEVTWPEIAPEDVTKKLQNIMTLFREQWITAKRGAEMAAKEMDIRGYNFEEEMKGILKEMEDSVMQELYNAKAEKAFSMAGLGKPGFGGAPGAKPEEPNGKPSSSGIGASSKGAIKKEYK